MEPGEIYPINIGFFDLSPIDESPNLVKTAGSFFYNGIIPFLMTHGSPKPHIQILEYPYDFGIEREVTVLKTGQEPYNWQVEDFENPKRRRLNYL
ncbi:MAG: hypothetical protein CM15mP36_01640 [Flavobacteriales bacterium]|nr:MAG: hypothetical protein CM15mP36_01640 [Flavobacteriales bacterium]